MNVRAFIGDCIIIELIDVFDTHDPDIYRAKDIRTSQGGWLHTEIPSDWAHAAQPVGGAL